MFDQTKKCGSHQTAVVCFISSLHFAILLKRLRLFSIEARLNFLMVQWVRLSVPTSWGYLFQQWIENKFPHVTLAALKKIMDSNLLSFSTNSSSILKLCIFCALGVPKYQQAVFPEFFYFPFPSLLKSVLLLLRTTPNFWKYFFQSNGSPHLWMA